MANIEIRGIAELRRKLGDMKAFEALRDPMQRSVLRLQRDMAHYPPPLPAQRYVRTGTLGRGWTTQVDQVAGGLEGRVGNRVDYAPRVQGYGLQEALFAGRWQTDQDVLERNREAIVRDFEKAIDDVLKR